jgi:hypothetical protein
MFPNLCGNSAFKPGQGIDQFLDVGFCDRLCYPVGESIAQGCRSQDGSSFVRVKNPKGCRQVRSLVHRPAARIELVRKRKLDEVIKRRLQFDFKPDD